MFQSAEAWDLEQGMLNSQCLGQPPSAGIFTTYAEEQGKEMEPASSFVPREAMSLLPDALQKIVFPCAP